MTLETAQRQARWKEAMHRTVRQPGADRSDARSAAPPPTVVVLKDKRRAGLLTTHDLGLARDKSGFLRLSAQISCNHVVIALLPRLNLHYG
jgi:hypothetical protein